MNRLNSWFNYGLVALLVVVCHTSARSEENSKALPPHVLPAVPGKPRVVIVDSKLGTDFELTDESRNALNGVRRGKTTFYHPNHRFQMSSIVSPQDEVIPETVVIIRPTPGVAVPQEYIEMIYKTIESSAQAAVELRKSWTEPPYPESFKNDGLGPLVSQPFNKDQWVFMPMPPGMAERFQPLKERLEQDPKDLKALGASIDYWRRFSNCRAVPFVDRFVAYHGVNRLYLSGLYSYIDGLVLIGRFEDAFACLQVMRSKYPGFMWTGRAASRFYDTRVDYAKRVEKDPIQAARALQESMRSRADVFGSSYFDNIFVDAVKGGHFHAEDLPLLDTVWPLLTAKDVQRFRTILEEAGMQPTAVMLAACKPLPEGIEMSSAALIKRAKYLTYGIDRNYEASLRLGRLALERARTGQDRLEQFEIELDLADLARDTGDLELLCELAPEAMRLAEELGGGAYLNLARQRLANMHTQLANPDEAMRILKEAFNSAKTLQDEYSDKLMEHYLQVAAQGNSGLDLEPMLKRQVVVAERWGSKGGPADFNLGLWYERQGRLEDAATYLQRSLQATTDTYKVQNFIALGRVFLAKSDAIQAEAQFDNAAKMEEKSSRRDATWAWQYGKAQARQAQGDAIGARTWIERCLETIDRQRACLSDWHFRRTLLNNKYAAYELAIRLALDRGDEAGAFDLAERARARSFLDMLGHPLKQSLHELPRSRAQIQEACDSDTLLAFFQISDRLLAWIVAKDRFEMVTMPLSAPNIADRVAAGYRSINAVDQANDAAWKASLQELYEQIWSPIAAKIPDGARLCIVPHQLLHYVPFQALYNGKAFLVESHELYYAPSASAFEALRKRKPNANAFSAFFDALLSKDPKSPFAHTETAAIRTLYPKAQVFEPEKATVERLQAVASEAGLLHIASHGYFDAQQPMKSGLKLSDGILSAKQVYELKLVDCHLVVMSACVSSVGELAGGDEVTGLTRAFQMAGAANVIGSLWPVSNDATITLMTYFYGELKKSPDDPVAALCMAQRRFLKVKPHPALWAAFQNTGMGKAVAP